MAPSFYLVRWTGVLLQPFSDLHTLIGERFVAANLQENANKDALDTTNLNQYVNLNIDLNYTTLITDDEQSKFWIVKPLRTKLGFLKANAQGVTEGQIWKIISNTK